MEPDKEQSDSLSASDSYESNHDQVKANYNCNTCTIKLKSKSNYLILRATILLRFDIYLYLMLRGMDKIFVFVEESTALCHLSLR